jgi:hypothetical protein
MTIQRPGSTPGHLLSIDDKVGRVVDSLARPSFAVLEPGSPRSAVEFPEQAVAMLVRAWRARFEYVPGEFISDPAWGILLFLLHAEIGGRQVAVRELCGLSGLPMTSALRWLDALEGRSLVVRQADLDDPDQALVALERETSFVLRRYVRDVVLAA